MVNLTINGLIYHSNDVHLTVGFGTNLRILIRFQGSYPHANAWVIKIIKALMFQIL